MVGLRLICVDKVLRPALQCLALAWCNEFSQRARHITLARLDFDEDNGACFAGNEVDFKPYAAVIACQYLPTVCLPPCGSGILAFTSTR